MQYIASTLVVECIAPASAVSNVVPALACGVVRSACGVACSAFSVVRSSCLTLGLFVVEHGERNDPGLNNSLGVKSHTRTLFS